MMPCYDYRCRECQNVIEIHTPLLDGEYVVLCEKCKVIMHKLPSAPNFKVEGGTPIFGASKQ